MINSSLTKRIPILTVFLLLISFILLPPHYAAAQTEDNNQHIYDKAELLSTSEREELEKMCITYSEKDAVDIIILTHNDSDAVYAETYIANFYDEHEFGDSVILLVDLSNRDVFIEGYGSAEESVNSEHGNTIISKISSDLSNGDYYQAFKQYISLSDQYINTRPIYENVWLQLAAALIISGIAVTIMAFNSGGRMTVGGTTYMDPNQSGLIGRRDDYIRTQVTRIRKPKNNEGNGGRGGGISAGGHSHSSAGGKF